eukprot:EG_transcript_27244
MAFLSPINILQKKKPTWKEVESSHFPHRDVFYCLFFQPGVLRVILGSIFGIFSPSVSISGHFGPSRPFACHFPLSCHFGPFWGNFSHPFLFLQSLIPHFVGLQQLLQISLTSRHLLWPPIGQCYVQPFILPTT